MPRINDEQCRTCIALPILTRKKHQETDLYGNISVITHTGYHPVLGLKTESNKVADFAFPFLKVTVSSIPTVC